MGPKIYIIMTCIIIKPETACTVGVVVAQFRGTEAEKKTHKSLMGAEISVISSVYLSIYGHVGQVFLMYLIPLQALNLRTFFSLQSEL